jgi:uncharacterized protein related to proFAR isomerase
VVGVLDLAEGCAVHARGGHRDRYAPVTSAAGGRIDPGDALALARAYIDTLGLVELYVADLDAIRRGRADHARRRSLAQDAAIAALAALGCPLWLDAGIATADQARRARDLGATHVVVGLETLPSYSALSDICAAVGGSTVAFSLDLRDGEPVLARGFPPGDRPEVIAAFAADAGVDSIIAIDLARVGSGAGVDLALVTGLRASVPKVALFAGGGVRGAEDLARLADAGCDGALVATALHDGRLGAADLAEVRGRQPRVMR